MPNLKDFEDFDNFDFEEKENKKPKLPKIKITKKHIIGIVSIAIIISLGYIYFQYLTPKHLKIECKTENGYSIPCPSYEIKDKKGKIVLKSNLLPGDYELIIHSNDYHDENSKKITVSTDPEQKKEIILSGIDIKYVDTNLTVYPRIKGGIKIIFINPYSKQIPYIIELKGDNGYYKTFKGKVTKKEQEVVIKDIFCQSTKKICLGKKEYLTYNLKIKYGDIKTEKKLHVYILPDIKLKFEGPTSITLYENKTLKQMYKVTLSDRLPKPIYNVSVEIVNLDPFIFNISKTKLNLYPGNPEEFNIIYKYSPGTQSKYPGTIKIIKDLYEYSKDITVTLKKKR